MTKSKYIENIVGYILQALILIFFVSVLTGCSYNGNLGANDQFEVNSRTELFAPSITVVTDKATGFSQVIGGQSAVSQLQGAASAAIFGTFISKGLRGSGDSNSINNTSNTSVRNRSSTISNQEQSQAQTQLQVQ